MLTLSPQPPRFLVVAEGRLVQRSANAGLRQGYPDKARGETKRRKEKSDPVLRKMISDLDGLWSKASSPPRFFRYFHVFI